MTSELLIPKIQEVLRDETVLRELVRCTDTAQISEVFLRYGLELSQETLAEVRESLEDAWGLRNGRLTDADLGKVSGGIGPIEFPPRRR